jgi:hypothetical protein
MPILGAMRLILDVLLLNYMGGSLGTSLQRVGARSLMGRMKRRPDPWCLHCPPDASDGPYCITQEMSRRV